MPKQVQQWTGKNGGLHCAPFRLALLPHHHQTTTRLCHTSIMAAAAYPAQQQMALPGQAVCFKGLAIGTSQQPAKLHRPAAATMSGVGSAGSVDLTGLWVKDQQRSDTGGYEASLDVLGLSGLQKVTARLIEGIEIQQTTSRFNVSFVTVVPFFKVTESAPWNASSQTGRRDLRFGWQSVTARQTPDGVLVEITWGPPMAGSITEQYMLLPDGSLRVHAETRVAGKGFAAADSIYTRSAASKDALLAASSRRHGSVTDVINRQKQQGLKM